MLSYFNSRPVACAHCHNEGNQTPLDYTNPNSEYAAVQAVPHGKVYHKMCVDSHIRPDCPFIKKIAEGAWSHLEPAGSSLNTRRVNDLLELYSRGKIQLKNEEDAPLWNAIHLLSAITAIALFTIPKLPLYGVFVGAMMVHLSAHLVAEQLGLFNFRIYADFIPRQ